MNTWCNLNYITYFFMWYNPNKYVPLYHTIILNMEWCLWITLGAMLHSLVIVTSVISQYKQSRILCLSSQVILERTLTWKVAGLDFYQINHCFWSGYMYNLVPLLIFASAVQNWVKSLDIWPIIAIDNHYWVKKFTWWIQ